MLVGPGRSARRARPFINFSLKIRVIPIMKTSHILAIIVSVAALAACGKKEEMPAPAAAPAAAEAVKDAASAATDAVATAATDAASAAAGAVADAASAATGAASAAAGAVADAVKKP